jgi:hypothetical protein
MGHPNGGKGNIFPTIHSFDEVYYHVGSHGLLFQSTTGEHITARKGLTRDHSTPTIVFTGERNRHGSICKSCWGYRVDCSGARIGQCAEALDQSF